MHFEVLPFQETSVYHATCSSTNIQRRALEQTLDTLRVEPPKADADSEIYHLCERKPISIDVMNVMECGLTARQTHKLR